MNLTPEQQAILNGEKGEVLAKVMKTLVMYGDAFGAEKLVPVTTSLQIFCRISCSSSSCISSSRATKSSSAAWA